MSVTASLPQNAVNVPSTGTSNPWTPALIVVGLIVVLGVIGGASARVGLWLGIAAIVVFSLKYLAGFFSNVSLPSASSIDVSQFFSKGS